MNIQAIKFWYPNGSQMFELGPIENISVMETIQLMGAGLQDITNKLPEFTKAASEVAEAYARAKENKDKLG